MYARTAVSSLLLGLLVSLSTTAGANDAVRDRLRLTPRPFGYFIGDVFEHRIRLSLAPEYRLDRGTLPSPGRINAWLELHAPRVEESIGDDGVVYDIELSYQVMNTLTHTYGLATPPVVVGVTGDNGESVPVVFPAWGFSVSPIDFAEAIPQGMLPTLKPDKPPPQIPAQSYRLRLVLWLVGLAGVLGYLGYLYVLIPVLARSNRPFSRAYKRLKLLARRPPSLEAEQQAFRQLHRAFDQTAARSLFQPGLPHFFDEHPSYRALQAPIEQFFRDSRRMFFGDDAARGDEQAVSRLLALCRACRDIERGAA